MNTKAYKGGPARAGRSLAYHDANQRARRSYPAERKSPRWKKTAASPTYRRIRAERLEAGLNEAIKFAAMFTTGFRKMFPHCEITLQVGPKK